MDGIQNLVNLESLWMGKNKIEELSHVGHLPRLRQLDVQNNRLTSLGEELLHCLSLEELYLACNNIPSISGDLPLVQPSTVRVIDLSSNKLSSILGISRLNHSLEELWLTGSDFTSFDELHELSALPKLSCIYLEHSPLWKHPNYTSKLKELIPTLTQIDADEL